MRTQLRLAVVMALAVAAGSMHAQTSTTCLREYNNLLSTNVFALGSDGDAFTMTVKQNFEQRLADGNSIHSSAEIRQARDSDGRTMVQRVEGCQLDSNGRPQFRVEVSVYDAKTGNSMHWTTGPGASTTVRINRVHPRGRVGIPTRGISTREVSPEPMARAIHGDAKEESLGSRNIAGMDATGMRTTEVIPAGRDGNEQPIEIVDEIWTSSTHLTLMKSRDDPRSGHKTWEVESVTSGAPDTALFTPPEGYTAREENTASTETTAP